MSTCDCEPCARVDANLAKPRMTDQPTEGDRFIHAKHLVRDNPAPKGKS